jgi:hypothetical protein
MEPTTRVHPTHPAEGVATDRACHVRAAILLFNHCVALRTVASLHAGEVVLPFVHVRLDQALGCFAVVFLTTELAGLLRTHLTGEFTAQSFPDVEYVLTVWLDTEH